MRCLNASLMCAVCTGDRSTLNSGKMVGRVLLGGKERNLNKFRQISAHVKQVCHQDAGGGCMQEAGAGAHTGTCTLFWGLTGDKLWQWHAQQ